jgi:hypothetical protein
MLVVLALSTSVAAAHGGLQPGVHVDPGSPAAKEYEIPLTQASQLGSGSSSSSGLQPGVHVDPGSPAAKEYEIPLTQASQLGSGSSSSSSGLQPGVHVDPGSPAAKEYAIPLNQATASKPSSSGSSTTTLFGVGINPSRSGNSGGQGSGTSHTKARGGGVQTALPSVVVPGSSGTDGGLLALLGGGVAILILGSFGGAVLRRSRHSPPT